MAIDPLDIAYIALGARRALAALPHAGLGLAACEGELGFVQACICHAGLLDRHGMRWLMAFRASGATRWPNPSVKHSASTCSQVAVRPRPSACCARSSMTA